MTEIIEAKYLPKGAELVQGRCLDMIPDLLSEGLIPISSSPAMDLRNQYPTADQDGPWRTLLNTDAGLATDGKKIYLFQHSEHLRKLTPKTRLTDAGIALQGNLSGAKSFDIGDLILGTDLTEKEALAHLLWLELARKDDESDEMAKKRLNEYVQNAFKLGKDAHDYDKNMRFYAPSSKNLVLMNVALYRLEHHSGAGGNWGLDYESGCLAWLPKDHTA